MQQQHKADPWHMLQPCSAASFSNMSAKAICQSAYSPCKTAVKLCGCTRHCLPKNQSLISTQNTDRCKQQQLQWLSVCGSCSAQHSKACAVDMCCAWHSTGFAASTCVCCKHAVSVTHRQRDTHRAYTACNASMDSSYHAQTNCAHTSRNESKAIKCSSVHPATLQQE